MAAVRGETTFWVNGRFLCRKQTGVERFGVELLRRVSSLVAAKDAAVEGMRFRIALPAEGDPQVEFPCIPMQRVGSSSGQWWEQYELPAVVESGQWLLSLCNTSPVRVRRQIVAIHDAATAAMPAGFSRSFRLWYRFLMPMLGRMAHSVLTVSEFSRQEIVDRFAVPAHKVTVVAEGGEHVLRCEADHGILDRLALRERPFILAVSSAAPHKNFKVVVDAMERLGNAPFDLVIAGGANSRVFGGASVGGGARCVKPAGYVSDGELRALYEGALAFVFPSLYEGFGIPPLEAMHCGCPVVASRAASIPEVCGDAALYFDPYSADELAAALLRLFDEPRQREELRLRGKHRASFYGWDRGAQTLLDVCRVAGR